MTPDRLRFLTHIAGQATKPISAAFSQVVAAPPPASLVNSGWINGAAIAAVRSSIAANVLMLVCDGLKGLPDAVDEVWPKTVVHTCVVHLLRASFRYAGRQDWDKIAKALKPVCTATTEDAATGRFLDFREERG